MADNTNVLMKEHNNYVIDYLKLLAAVDRLLTVVDELIASVGRLLAVFDRLLLI